MEPLLENIYDFNLGVNELIDFKRVFFIFLLENFE